MKKLILLALTAVALCGCVSTGDYAKIKKEDIKVLKAREDITLCGKCGEIKGIPECCKPKSKDVPVCKKCGFPKDSFRYRIIQATTDDATEDVLAALKAREDVTICGKCGKLKCDAECCKEGIRSWW